MAVNLWPNADLESGIAEWNEESNVALSSATDQSWSTDGGTHSLKIIPVGTYDGAVSDTLSAGIAAETQYTASWYFRTNSAAQAYDMKVRDQDGNTLVQETNQTYTADTWVRIDLTFTTGADDTGIKLLIRTGGSYDSGSECWVDGIMLETGAAASAWVNSAATVSFSATVAAVTTTGTAGDGLWDMGPFIYTGGSGGAAALHITHDYSATIAASAATGTPELNVATTDEFSATIAAVVTTGTPALLTGAQLSGIDPTITSATTARTITSATTARTTASSTTARTITSSTTARTIHSK